MFTQMSLRLILTISFGCWQLHAWNLPNHHHHHHPPSHHPCTRRGFGETFVVVGTLLTTTPALAEEDAFDAVRRELYSSDGGVAYMQRCLDQNDFTALLENSPKRTIKSCGKVPWVKPRNLY